MAQPKKARGGLPFLWTIIGLGLIALVALATRFVPTGSEYDATRKAQRLANLEEVSKAAQEKLTGYAWVNQERGVVRIPIEKAMQLAVVDLKKAGVTPSEVKAESFGTNLIPAYLKPAEPEAPAEGEATAPAAEGEATPAASPEAVAPSTEPAASPAPEATSEATEAQPAATPQAPATETPTPTEAQ